MFVLPFLLPALLFFHRADAAELASASNGGGGDNVAAASVGTDGSVEVVGEAQTSLEDDEEECPNWARRGECDANPGYMLSRCRKSCKIFGRNGGGKGVGASRWLIETEIGVPQLIEGANSGKTREVLRHAEEYFRNEVQVKEDYHAVRHTCRLQHENCASWASTGECEANPAYMQVQCAPVCRTCAKVNYDTRCPRDSNAKEAMAAGDLNAMFERITESSNDQLAKLKPRILSQPNEGPWVVTFDEFLTPEECDRLIELGTIRGYEGSTEVGKEKFDGTFDKQTSNRRTSANAWCENECYNDPITRRVLDRISNLTSIPEENSEHLQLLKYEEGQFYKVHHDYILYQRERPQGPRILTLFLYLNDVEAGGGTRFPHLNLTVMPKKGKALLWPSVLNINPLEKDFRTDHEALPVEKGVKYAANAWLHLRDFKGPFETGCI